MQVARAHRSRPIARGAAGAAAQQYFLRENLRLRLLAARIALLSRDDKSVQGRPDRGERVDQAVLRHADEAGAGAVATLTQLAATPMPADDARSRRAASSRRVRSSGAREPRRARAGGAARARSDASRARAVRVPAARRGGGRRRAARQAQHRLCAVRRAAVSRRALAQRVRRPGAARRSSSLYVLLRVAAQARADAAEVRAEPAPPPDRARARASRTRRSSRCSKAATARRASSRKKRWRFPDRRRSAALIAARAALDMREFARRRSARSRGPTRSVTSLAVPRLMLEAELALERGQPAEALARARGAQAGSGPAHRGAAARAARADRGAAPRRDSADRRPARQAQGLRRGAGRAAARHRARRSARARCRTTPSGLRDYWNRLPEADRLQPEGRARGRARASSRSAAIARPPRSSRAASSATGTRTSSRSTRECTTADTTRAARDGRALAHRRTTRTRRCSTRSGRLCEREQLWGKAQTYLEASLALDDRWRAHLALGELHGAARPAPTKRTRISPPRSSSRWRWSGPQRTEDRAAEDRKSA